MNIQIELLRIQQLNPLQKLILGLILDEPPYMLQLLGGYDKKCGEIGEELGVSRAQIKVDIEELI